jgi:hypothetical protein
LLDRLALVFCLTVSTFGEAAGALNKLGKLPIENNCA